MSNLVVREFNQSEVQLIKETVCRNSSDSELKLFLAVAGKTQLDPFTKQIYAVKRWDSNLQREAMSIQTGIDGFRLIAQRTGKYAGQLGPFWCGPDGKWADVWLKDEPPAAAKVAVLHADFKEPLWAVAKFSSYAQKTKAGGLTRFWQTMPELMIAKVAESLALRKAFPNELSGIYTAEEMNQADNAEISKPAKISAASTQERDITPRPEPEPVKLDPVKAEPIEEVESPGQMQSIGDYVVKTGKKYVGRKLKDIPTNEIESFRQWVLTKAGANFRNMADTKEFMFFSDQYLKRQASESKDDEGDLDKALGAPNDDWKNDDFD